MIALAFRKLARLSIPEFPRNFNRWGGKSLNPLLFVALYFFCRINCNSSVEIRCGVGSVSGLYSSGVAAVSKKMS